MNPTKERFNQTLTVPKWEFIDRPFFLPPTNVLTRPPTWLSNVGVGLTESCIRRKLGALCV